MGQPAGQLVLPVGQALHAACQTFDLMRQRRDVGRGRTRTAQKCDQQNEDQQRQNATHNGEQRDRIIQGNRQVIHQLRPKSRSMSASLSFT